MQATRAILCRRERVHDTLLLAQRAILQGQVDPNQVLELRLPRTDGQVTDLTVAHDPLRQTHRQPACVDGSEAIVLHHTGHHRGLRRRDGIAIGVLPQAPPVNANQARLLYHLGMRCGCLGDLA
eukprot:3857581-Pyramimonas_sp.AAC.1